MSTLVLDQVRQDIMREGGHLLIHGGPGCGKTTMALLKAKACCGRLLAGQDVLFLSFSRAAVHQVLSKSQSLLSASERAVIDVQTYHSFCIDLLSAHGQLLRGSLCHFIYPGEERLHRSRAGDDWERDRVRLAREESRFCFDRRRTAAAVRGDPSLVRREVPIDYPR